MFHNLFSFDIIFCRNVMIYLNAETVQKLVNQFQEALVPDGWLVVGHADHNIQQFTAFNTVMKPGASFYQNSPKPQPKEPKFAQPFQYPGLPDSTEPAWPNFSGHPVGMAPKKALNLNKTRQTVLTTEKVRAFKPVQTRPEKKKMKTAFQAQRSSPG